MEGEAPPNTIFDEADPPVGGLRSWPQIRRTTPNNSDTILKLTNIKTDIKKEIEVTNYTTSSGIFGELLRKAREMGIDKCRQDSYEVAWGTHVYRCKRKHNT